MPASRPQTVSLLYANVAKILHGVSLKSPNHSPRLAVLETRIGLFPLNDSAGHRPNCRQVTQCDSPTAEAETDTQDRVSICKKFRDWHQGSLQASMGTLSGNVVGKAFGAREPESLAGLPFVPKLM
jgi:hypothetical protein